MKYGKANIMQNNSWRESYATSDICLKRNSRRIRIPMLVDHERCMWRIQQSRRFLVFVVYLSLFLDNMLLTVVVPIIPDMLYSMDCQEKSSSAYPCHPEFIVKNNTRCFSKETGILKKYPTMDSNTTDNTSANSWLNNYRRDAVSRSIVVENGEIGLLFASKALVQLVSNAFVGSWTNRIGYTTPLFVGTIVLLTSSLVYTFGDTYTTLFTARSIHGFGSACVFIAGMAMVADRYPDDQERSKIMGLTLGGTAVGVLVGYPFGGVMYYLMGKTVPLAILSLLLALNTVFQLVFLRPRLEPERLLIGTSIFKLLSDPYIMLTAGSICVSTSTIAVLEIGLPIWLIEVINPPKWQLGTVFIPDSVGYLLGTNMFGSLAFKIGRWLTSIFSMLLVGLCAITIPFSSEMVQLLLPHFGLGLGIGITDAALMPLLAYFVDTRYVALYGSVYAIAQVAVSLAYSLGPLIGGEMVKTIGFPWVMRWLGILNLMFSPLAYFLRNPKPVEENKPINMKTTLVSETKDAGRQRTGPIYSSFIDED